MLKNHADIPADRVDIDTFGADVLTIHINCTAVILFQPVDTAQKG